MPLLQVKFIKFINKDFYLGSICKIPLTLKNVGQTSLSDLYCTIEPSENLLINKKIENSSKPLVDKNNDQKKKKKSKLKLMKDMFSNYNSSCYKLPIKKIGRNEQIEIMINFRMFKLGIHDLYLLFYYKKSSGKISKKLPYRLLRIHKQIKIIPSIKINTKLLPSSKNINEFNIICNIHNLTKKKILKLQQLTSISNRWKAVPLSLTKK
ncbi:transport protein trapp [Anaeramoeba flamelloides]|uniref:Transport protein trapp n=1 Tax=Anaeramoeba flamelloides TaxID=1746091 RepID=A0AAV7YR74_9EUKA|nr:transport protein trapp [Anaeramoeba flamelloides]